MASELQLSLYFPKGRVHVEQLPGGLWYAQYITWVGSRGRRATGMTALRAVNAIRDEHGLRGLRRWTGRRALQVNDRRPPHYRRSNRAPISGAGSNEVTK